MQRTEDELLGQTAETYRTTGSTRLASSEVPRGYVVALSPGRGYPAALVAGDDWYAIYHGLTWAWTTADEGDSRGIGTWHDNNNVVMIEHITTREDRALAMELARHHHQRFIYDVEAGESIPVEY